MADLIAPVLVLKFTGTWCTYCPNMTAALETVEEAYPGRMIIMAMHSGCLLYTSRCV